MILQVNKSFMEKIMNDESLKTIETSPDWMICRQPSEL